MPAAGGLAAGGLRYAAAIGAEAIQVFAANPRGWAVPPADPAQDAALRTAASDGQLPVFVHAPYLINLGSPDPRVRDLSVAALQHALARGGQLGARGVVVHTGSAVGGDPAAALRQVREVLLPLLEALASDGPGLLLEPMAGQGTMLCSGVAELRAYLAMLDWHPRAGLCLDTCHAFAAGHDLAAPGGAARLLADLESAGCADRLRLVHANDAKDPCGSGRDRHENIGSGHLGTGPFGELLGHPATAGVPFIVETPGGEQAHAADVAVLQGLRAAACGQQA
ncbi:MAG: deoxyribonuclease IV [Actinomycetota bacterium]